MLLRRAAIATFALAAVLVVACGHQVTPNPTFNNLSGDIVLKFRVNGTLDFNDYTYAVVVDTCGLGTPYPQALNTTFNSFSYAFFVGGSYGTALPQLVEYFVSPNSSGTILHVNVPESASLEQFVPNDNNLGNEFELIFKRSELANPLNQAQPCPNIPATTASAVPTASAGASPTATPTVAPTLAPGASPTPSPTATPVGQPTQSIQSSWAFNFFTIQQVGGASTILDSLGVGGPTDVTYNSAIVDVNSSQDIPIFKATGGTQPGNPSAQLAGGEIQNYP